MPELGVVLVDDHPIVLSALVQIFEGEPGFAVVAACHNGEEALAAVARHRPELLLLDVYLPDGDALDLLPKVAALSPATRAVVFTASLEEERIVAALHRGAKAVLFKETPAAELLSAMRRVAAGSAGITPEDFTAELPGEPSAGAARSPVSAGRLLAASDAALLSPREREIAEMVARGERNKEIAWRLGLAEGTVKLHISRAFKKLGVGNRVGLSRIIARRG